MNSKTGHYTTLADKNRAKEIAFDLHKSSESESDEGLNFSESEKSDSAKHVKKGDRFIDIYSPRGNNRYRIYSRRPENVKIESRFEKRIELEHI